MSLATNLKPLVNSTASAKASAMDPAASALKKAELRKACRMFEGHFLKLMMGEMRKTVEKGKMLNGGMAEDMFTSMLDQSVADEYVKDRSMGLADMLERQLGNNYLSRPVKPAGGDKKAPAGLSSQAQGLASPVEGEVTSPFGPRVHPITGQLARHDGLDIAAPEGAPVKAAAAGLVSFAGERGGYGNLVVLTHADGKRTYYGHLSSMSVTAGQKVNEGQTIGAVGNTGRSTGPHLHFEVRDKNNRPADPAGQLNLA